MSQATAALRGAARRLLNGRGVQVVIGHTETGPGQTAPLFATTPQDCDRLVFNDRCYANLTTYLTKPEVKAMGRVAVVVKGCDSRAINGLLREAQIRREEIHVIGVACPGMDKAICSWCTQHEPVIFDDHIPADTPPPAAAERPADPTAGMSAQERWDYWMGEFSRCVRCYACRAVCPMCHCKRCLADQNQPQSIDTSATPRGNLMWNLIRAFHQVGRCVECGECERACPMEIPLMRFTARVRDLVRDRYQFVPGRDAETPVPLATFRESDQEDFFL